MVADKFYLVYFLVEGVVRGNSEKKNKELLEIVAKRGIFVSFLSHSIAKQLSCESSAQQSWESSSASAVSVMSWSTNCTIQFPPKKYNNLISFLFF